MQAVIPDYAATVAGLSIVFPAVRWALHHGVFKPLAEEMAPKRLRDEPHNNYKNHVEKACESLWKLVVYSIFMVVGIKATYAEPWLRDTKHYWIDWPTHSPTPMMQLQYCLESAFYLSSIVMLLFWEVKRKDFLAMFVHHIATVVLQVASYNLSFVRVGSVIMVLHDVNDVLLEASKLANYWEYKTAATGWFVTFVVVWAILRLGYFPFMIVRSTLFEQVQVIGYQPPCYYLFNGLLCLLVCLHVYWFGLILRIVKMHLTTGKVRDVREDDES